jgi:hypothetical protein
MRLNAHEMTMLSKELRYEAPKREPGEPEVVHRMRCMDAFELLNKGFHLPTPKGIKAIVEATLKASDGKPPYLLGLGSGQAFTESVVARLCPYITVEATDPFLTHGTGSQKSHMPVMVMTAMEAIELRLKGNPNTCILFSWPNYDDPWSGEALQRIVGFATRATHVVHIGDITPGGFTGSPLFHELLEKHFEFVKTAPAANWPYREDVVAVFRFIGRESNAEKVEVDT